MKLKKIHNRVVITQYQSLLWTETFLLAKFEMEAKQIQTLFAENDTFKEQSHSVLLTYFKSAYLSAHLRHHLHWPTLWKTVTA